MTGNIGIVGAGLAGAMTGLLLSKIGFNVTIFDKRQANSDEECHLNSAYGASTSAVKRSINLALSDRGLSALSELDLVDVALQNAVPMSGRVIHDMKGGTTRQQYGTKTQYLNSVSRTELNDLLLVRLIKFNERSKDSHRSIQLKFGYTLLEANIDGSCSFKTSTGTIEKYSFDVLIGADGAYSALREYLLKSGRIDFSRQYIGHGYKELHIPPIINTTTGESDYAFSDYQGLHIWPRKEFMLIALPNKDKSFTATLFSPYTSSHGGFDSINPTCPETVLRHFQTYFPDILPIMPTLVSDYAQNPVGSLVTIRVNPWNKGRLLVIGDAAHAVVPFYGQGMNAAFEDALVLYQLFRDKYISTTLHQTNITSSSITYTTTQTKTNESDSDSSNTNDVINTAKANTDHVNTTTTTCVASSSSSTTSSSTTVPTASTLITTAMSVDSWTIEKILEAFSQLRQPACNGLADLCIEHYHDMAANTTSFLYLLTKRIEATIHYLFPHTFIPLYTMVTFSRIPYHLAREKAIQQEKLIKNVLLGTCGVTLVGLVGSIYISKRMK